ncbi:hypothetical protein RJ55_04255 [Drechmeria coniospora]|nr:hypothetical protein RJ55_04255 [Drechmeria coniospora]
MFVPAPHTGSSTCAGTCTRASSPWAAVEPMSALPLCRSAAVVGRAPVGSTSGRIIDSGARWSIGRGSTDDGRMTCTRASSQVRRERTPNRGGDSFGGSPAGLPPASATSTSSAGSSTLLVPSC